MEAMGYPEQGLDLQASQVPAHHDLSISAPVEAGPPVATTDPVEPDDRIFVPL